MKRTLCKFLSLLLSVVLLTIVAAPAIASTALGDDLTSVSTTLHESTRLSKNVFWSSTYSDLRTEQLITYTPNTLVTPIVTYGTTLSHCSTLSAAAASLESQGYRVVAGINGDFFNFNNGLPVGMVVSQGKLLASDGGLSAIGFRADGTTIIGKPSLTMRVDLGFVGEDGSEQYRQVYGVNRPREAIGGYFLYTYDYNSSHTTGNTKPGVDLLCNITGGELKIGSTLDLEAVQVIEDGGAVSIGQNQVVISASRDLDVYFRDALWYVSPGSTLHISVTAADVAWNDVQYAVGALYPVVENGAITNIKMTSGANPYTAIGTRPDGTLVLYTIDGRRSGHSIGATMHQVAARMIELGCSSAVCLDGGGSTTLTVTQPTDTVAKTINVPSDGGERSVSNQIFLVASNQPSGELGSFAVDPESNYVMAGSRVNIATAALDTNYIPMEEQPYKLTATAGTVEGEYLITPPDGGDVVVTATNPDGTRAGSAVIHVIAAPEGIRVSSDKGTHTALTVAAGSTTQLYATALYHRQTILSDNKLFSWSLDSDIGVIDNSGKLTALAPGSGNLTITSASGLSQTIPITVSGAFPLQKMEDFESGAGTFQETHNVQLQHQSDVVRYGSAALQVNYGSIADLTAEYTVPEPYTGVSLWVYGDASGAVLTFQTADGQSASLGTVDFSGWHPMTAALAPNTVITGLHIQSAQSGTLYLDQMVATTGGRTDIGAPVVTASIAGGKVLGSVTDEVDGVLPKESIRVTRDGAEIAFDYDAGTGALSAPLNITDEAGHRFTITAVDASGNIGRGSADWTATAAAHQFTDLEGYWAADYVDWLKFAGITNGYANGTFQPNQSISRQEFAVMLYRYLRIDGSQYADVALPFADRDAIGEYAINAIQTLYSRGIINGNIGADGQLYFQPDSSLTRAQAAAMIGRTQVKGYPIADGAFTDGDTIPGYAAEYIQSMVAQKVINGYTDGSFRPNVRISRGEMAKILYNLI